MDEVLTQELSEMELEDDFGTLVRLGSLWADGPRVLLFVRHFG